MREDRDGTITILMSTYRLDKEVATEGYDSFIKGFNLVGSLPEAGLRPLFDDTNRLLKIDREIALNEVSDFAILREVQRELGIVGRSIPPKVLVRLDKMSNRRQDALNSPSI